MHTLVKTAFAIHNLSLAAAYGGPLFAKVALRPAVIKDIADEKERGRLMQTAWTKYNKIYVPATVMFGATWLVERRAILDLGVSHRTRKLVGLKDLLIAGSFLTGMALVHAGKQLKKEFPSGIPVLPEDKTAAPEVEKYRRFFHKVGPLNLAMVAGSIAIGPLIGASILHDRRGLLARLFGK